MTKRDELIKELVFEMKSEICCSCEEGHCHCYEDAAECIADLIIQRENDLLDEVEKYVKKGLLDGNILSKIKKDSINVRTLKMCFMYENALRDTLLIINSKRGGK